MNRLLKLLLLKLCLIESLCSLFAQVNPNPVPVFKDQDRICFVGNSITYAGGFHHNIAMYYAVHYPSQKIRFFNCGISGSTTAGILRRLDSDVLSRKPTYAVIMIGMNDVRRLLYTKTSRASLDTQLLKQAALDQYKKDLDKIVGMLLTKHVRVILQKPSIYDQTAVLPAANQYGSNDALKICAEYMQELADKYKLQTVDYWSILKNINENLQRKDAASTIIGKDRVHPGTEGHFIMAYEFIKTTGTDPFVANIVVDKNAGKSNRLSKRCSLTNINYRDDGVSFSCLGEALPFPLMNELDSSLKLVPFTQHMNREILCVNGLHAGDYNLFVDSVFIRSVNAAALKSGINLALMPEMPQARQAMKVFKIFDSLFIIEHNLRIIRQIDDIDLMSAFSDKTNPEAVGAYLNAINDKRPFPSVSFRNQIARYVQLKPGEAEMETLLQQIQDRVYKENQPRRHSYRLLKQ